MPSAVRLARPAHLWLPGSFAGDERYDSLLKEALAAGTEIRWIGSSGISASVGGADLRVFWVDGPTENDRSLVLRISAGGRVALLPADVQVDGQEALLASGFSPRCDLLLAPHHGAANAADPRFLAATRPSVVVISAGGRPGLPSPEFLEAARNTGAEIRATYAGGCVEVVLAPDRLRVRTEGRR